MSKDDIKIIIDGGKVPNVTANALHDMENNMKYMERYFILSSQMTKWKYNALIKEGFSEQQAIELCKQLF